MKDLRQQLEKKQKQAADVIKRENKVKNEKIKKHLAKSLEKIANNQNNKKMESKEGMAKIKTYESEQTVVNLKVKENRDKKLQEILNYNGMLNQKRKENLQHKRMADKALS